jgi:hypothetical protein
MNYDLGKIHDFDKLDGIYDFKTLDSSIDDYNIDYYKSKDYYRCNRCELIFYKSCDLSFNEWHEFGLSLQKGLLYKDLVYILNHGLSCSEIILYKVL